MSYVTVKDKIVMQPYVGEEIQKYVKSTTTNLHLASVVDYDLVTMLSMIGSDPIPVGTYSHNV